MISIVEENKEDRQVKRTAPNVREGLIAIIPHGVAFAGVEGVSVEKVDDAFEEVIEADGGENEPDGQQDGAQIVGGKMDIEPDLEVEEEGAE